MQDTKDQLIAIYESHDDVKRMGELENGIKFLQSTCKTQQQEIKQIITDIIEKNSKLEPQTKRSEPLEDHQKRMKMIQLELDQVKANLTNLGKVAE